MFELLKKEVEKFHERRMEKLQKEDAEDVILFYGTNLTIKQYKGGDISEEVAYKRAFKCASNLLNKSKNNDFEKIELAEKAKDLEYINICVEWKKSATWGANANAEIETNAGKYSGRASGCGYDKESAAIAEALNQSPEVLKCLYTLTDKMLAEVGSNAYYYTGCGSCVDWRNSIGYGSGYDIIPYFEGGVGFNCFIHILEKMGYAKILEKSGERFDFYAFKKEA